jgi:hypothetical protein
MNRPKTADFLLLRLLKTLWESFMREHVLSASGSTRHASERSGMFAL